MTTHFYTLPVFLEQTLLRLHRCNVHRLQWGSLKCISGSLLVALIYVIGEKPEVGQYWDSNVAIGGREREGGRGRERVRERKRERILHFALLCTLCTMLQRVSCVLVSVSCTLWNVKWASSWKCLLWEMRRKKVWALKRKRHKNNQPSLSNPVFGSVQPKSTVQIRACLSFSCVTLDLINISEPFSPS